jgi:predicted AAA+ superfamily ATPase
VKKELGEEEKRFMTMTLEQQVNQTNLEVLAEITEVPVTLKEFCSDWILFTYDLPNTPEGIKARYSFLGKAKYLGAMQHTESVYLMPWTDLANAVALELAEAGEIYLWYTKAGNESQSIDLTENYDRQIEVSLEKIRERVDKIWSHVPKGHTQQVHRMANKTWEQLIPLSRAIVSRGNEKLADKAHSLMESLRHAEASV